MRPYFRGLPFLVKISPRLSALQRSKPAFLSASHRACRGGIMRAALKRFCRRGITIMKFWRWSFAPLCRRRNQTKHAARLLNGNEEGFVGIALCAKVRRSKPGLAGSMQHNLIGLPHPEQFRTPISATLKTGLG
jgi:hypothetical protein